MNKQTNFLLLSLTIFFSSNAFSEETTTDQETSCFNNLAALTTENFEQTRDAYATCLANEAIEFNMSISCKNPEGSRTLRIISEKNNIPLEATENLKYSGIWPFNNKRTANYSCSDKTINCKALYQAILKAEKTLFDFSTKDLLGKKIIKHKDVIDFKSILSNIESSFVKEEEEERLYVSHSIYDDSYYCSREKNDEKIKISDSECKHLFALVQEAYNKQISDKKA